jgi:serine/threonine protein kinase
MATVLVAVLSRTALEGGMVGTCIWRTPSLSLVRIVSLQQNKPSQGHTAPRLLQGTMSHMSPEALLHGRISKAGDVYSFGITLWELFTSGHAYAGERVRCG